MRKPKQVDRDKERIAHYRTHRNKVGEAVLRAALRALATVDAGKMVNDILEMNLDLVGVNISVKELNENAITVLRSEISAILAENSILSPTAKQQLVDRVIARMAPTRDNVGVPSPQRKSPIERVEDLEKVIAREMRNSFPPGEKK